MALRTLDETLDWMHQPDPTNTPQKIVFHGGEPLLVPAGFYRYALPLIRQLFGYDHLHVNIQSNLWFLTDELCELFLEYGVGLGTSLDGPEEITDRQRGSGYFRRTVRGIELARRNGLGVGCICTFTAQSALRYHEVFDFFAREGLDFSVHAAVPAMNPAIAGNDICLLPHDFGELLVKMLDIYVADMTRVRISTLDALSRSVSAGNGGGCTFTDCLGKYLAVAPDGRIYPCQRFAGNVELCLGNVHERPQLAQLRQTPVWRLFRQREEHVAGECGECSYFSFCKGGCPYDALAAGSGTFRALRDPYCQAHKRIFSHITEKALAEVFSDDNINEVLADPDTGSLLRKGPILTLMRGGPHPAEIARRARELILAVALAHDESPALVVSRLQQAGFVSDPVRAHASVLALRRRLGKRPEGFHNIYVHVTYDCNLACLHCYASAGPHAVARAGPMPVRNLVTLAKESAILRFRKLVVTGGEPLTHPCRDAMLDALTALRGDVKPMRTVLRSNLSAEMDFALIERIASCTDDLVVSIDGDRAFHDARRGGGSFDRTVTNLRSLVQINQGCEVSLLAVLSSQQVAGPEGRAVKSLAADLGGLPVRFKPLLPLGRAHQNGGDLTPDTDWKALKKEELLAYGFRPLSTCGVGYSVYVGPGGEAYPCYALVGNGRFLGNVFAGDGLSTIITSDAFQALCRHTVDTNRKCRYCVLRYLCGGACRAWASCSEKSSPVETPLSLDEPPPDCHALQHRGRELLVTALETLGSSPAQWVGAGFSFPEVSSV